MRKIIVFSAILALFSSMASATTYTATYGGNPNHSAQVTLGSSHTFEVGLCPGGYHVEWYLTYSGGSPVETDTFPLLPFTAARTQAFSSPGTAWVRAEIYNASWSPVETHRWEVTVGAPDLIVEDVWTEPIPVIENEDYRIFARIRNIGDVVASVTLGSQEARFFVDGVPVNTVSYDDVIPGGSVVVQTSMLTGPSPAGSHSVRVEADYYDEVDEEIEGNNSRTEPMDVVIPDLIVEYITIDPGYAWRPTTITAVIRNQGGATAEFGLFDRVCRFEVDGQVDYDTASYVTIPPGGTYNAEASFIISGVGSNPVAALADPDNEVNEEIEGNNSRTESETWTASTIHDTDGDGMIDADEVIAGSEPDNSNSVWQCSLVLTNGGFRISWPSISGRTYTVMRTTNLTNDFIAISPPLPGSPPENWLESINMPSNAFYRVIVEE